MVLLTITAPLLDVICRLEEAGKPLPRQQSQTAASSDESSSGEPLLESPSLGDPIAHGQIIDLWQAINDLEADSTDDVAKTTSSWRLQDLLRGSHVYVEPPRPKAIPSSEYKALMARLRQDEEARTYERMTSPLMQKETFAQRFAGSQHAQLFPTSQTDIGDEDETTYNDINRQLTVIFNVIVSIVACSAAIWIVARHWSVPTRLGLSMGGSGLVGAAEVIVYAGYLRRVKEAKLKEKNAVEVKEVVDTWVIKGNSSHATHTHVMSAAKNDLGSDSLRRRAAGSGDP